MIGSMKSITRGRSRRQLARRRATTRRNYKRRGTVRVFTCKRRARRSVICKKMHGGVGIEDVAGRRDPVIAIVGGVPVGITEDTFRKLDRTDGDSFID